MGSFFDNDTSLMLNCTFLVVIAAAAALQSCPTLCNPMNCSPPGVLCPWDSPGKNTGVDRHSLLQGIFPTQESNPRLLCSLHWQMVSLPLPQLARLLVVNQVTKIFIIKFDRIARTCKQPKCPCIEEWVKKIYICTKEFIFLTQP